MNHQFSTKSMFFIIIMLSICCNGEKSMINESKSETIVKGKNSDKSKPMPEEKGLFMIRWQLESKGENAVAYYLEGKRYVGDKGLIKLFQKLEKEKCNRIIIEYSDGVSGLDKKLPFPVDDDKTLEKVKKIVKEKLKCKVVVRKLKQEEPDEAW